MKKLTLGMLLTGIIVAGSVTAYAFLRTDSIPSNTTPSHTNTQPTSVHGRATYTSTLGKFSFTYPESWYVSGAQNFEQKNKSLLTGKETSLLLSNQSLPPSPHSQNKFIVSITVDDSPPTRTPFNTYPNGNVTTLPSGLAMWQEKQNITTAIGPTTVDCPKIRLAQNQVFSALLPSGKYLQVEASFCEIQGLITSYTYEQQVTHPAYQETLLILSSFQLTH